MTDIHDLDQYVGRYIVLTDPDGESAAGFLVKVHDEVDYVPHPVRSIMLGWGQGWRVGEDTQIDVFPAGPNGEDAPKVLSAIDVLHEWAHEGGCPDGNCRVRARRQLRALRIWRMRQENVYWQYTYLRAARKVKDDLAAVNRLIEQAMEEGAPAEFIDHLISVGARAQKTVKGDR